MHMSAPPSLRRLRCGWLHADDIKALPSTLHSLSMIVPHTSLPNYKCVGTLDDTVAACCTQTQLTSLSLEDYNRELSNTQLSMLAEHLRLNALSVGQLGCITKQVSLPTLTQLRVGGNGALNVNVPQLQSLSVEENYPNHCDERILFEPLTALTTLHIRCVGFPMTPEVMSRIATLVTLRDLCISTKAVVPLSPLSSLTNLTKLDAFHDRDLPACPSVTTVTIHNTATNLPLLPVLYPNLTALMLEDRTPALPLPYMPHLRTIYTTNFDFDRRLLANFPTPPVIIDEYIM